MSQRRVALVTGGSRGIGLAIARAFVRRDFDVAITGTDQNHLDEARAQLRQEQAEVLALKADVRDPDAVERAVETTVSACGGVDLLVNNAGVGIFRSVAEMSIDEWNRVIQTNLTGVFHCCRAVLPRLRARGGGWIINVSSLAATNPFPDAAAYCASKAALNAFTEALMQEVRQDGIRVATVLPGSVRTGFSGRSPTSGDDWKLDPEDVAQVVVDLVAHPTRSLPSRVEIRPARPPRKG